jgi:2-hydroxy-6-oxonona-2,4-dienedioate hydrolase
MTDDPAFDDLWTTLGDEWGGVRLHSLCSRQGSGDDPPVIFLPGLGTSSRTVVPTARLLLDGRRLFLLDLPGLGESERAQVPDMAAYGRIVASWLEALGIRRTSVVGHSFGAQVAVELAMRHRDLVGHLALVSLTVDPDARTMPQQFARLLLDATREPPKLLGLLAGDYLRAGVPQLFAIGRIALRDRVEAKLPSTRASTLFVCGGRDPLVPRRWAEQMASLAPLSKLVVIPDATHAVPYDAPVELARELQGFLPRRQVAASAPTG